MAEKRFFFGKYYKCIANDGFSFALIDSESNDGKEKQFITKDGSYQIKDVTQIDVKETEIVFNVKQEDLTVEGKVSFSNMHPLHKEVMGPFALFKMECSHEVYSMYHNVEGELSINGKAHKFIYGYIEGDRGVNFPTEYIWYNSVGKDYGVTLAIATIPFGPIKFTGVLGFVSYEGKEYYLCTYTGVKREKVDPKEIIIRKGSKKLRILIEEQGGHLLKAPENGSMSRYIKENIATPTRVIFTEKDRIILDREDKLSSLEYMYN